MTNIELAKKYGIEATETSKGNENSKILRVRGYDLETGTRVLWMTDVIYKTGRMASYSYGNEPKSVKEFIRNAKHSVRWNCLGTENVVRW